MHLSFQKIFFAIATVVSVFAILFLAQSILIPLSFAFLLSLILYPLVKKLESWGVNKILAAFTSIVIVLVTICGSIFLFSTQLIKRTKEFSNFQGKILHVFAEATLYINDNLNFVHNLKKNELIELLKDWVGQSSGALVRQTFSSTATFLAGMLATIIFTFLILIYRKGLLTAFTSFYPEHKQEKVATMFQSVKQVGQKYLFGMIILIVVIGVANSIGLLIIGIDNPFLFGFLGAVLAIIPYVGTVSGAIIPTLYAFISYNSVWMPLEIAILFWAVQLISDNFLSPKIVGGSININALTAILSLIIGAAVWGIAGMILFLPFAAMLMVVCESYEELKPIALLIGNKNYQDTDSSNTFTQKWLKKLKTWYSNFHFRSTKN
jgi:predicted PurR-regulated permease PerM